jgi:hypothetical protein
VTISDTIRAKLVTAGVASATIAAGTNWVALIGGLNDKIKAPQIAVRETAGLTPLTSHGTKGPLRIGVQLMVRGLPNTYTQTETKTNELWNVLQRARFGPIMSMEGVNNPIWLGYEQDTNAPMWSINFIAFTETT